MTTKALMEILAEWGEVSKYHVWCGMRDQLQLERAKAIIRAQRKFQLLGAEDARRLKGFAALLSATYTGDFGTEGR